MKLAAKIGIGLASAVVAVGGVAGATQLTHTVAQSGGQTQQGGMPGGGGPGGQQGSGQQGGMPGAQSGQQGDGQQGGVPAELVSTLATKFNLSEDTVKTALTSAFSSVQQQNLQPGDAMDSALAKQLASDLKLDESKVKAALVEFRTSRAASGQPGDAPSGAPSGAAPAGNE